MMQLMQHDHGAMIIPQIAGPLQGFQITLIEPHGLDEKTLSPLDIIIG